MKRRTFILGGATLTTASLAGVALWPEQRSAIAAGHFDWKGADFLAGGTSSIKADALVAPVFRALPNCVTTVAQTLGPCYVNGIPLREDVTEGRTGLPVRVAFRLVRSADCSPIANADVEIWHTDSRGIYSGREASDMCTSGDADAISSHAFRGRQITGADGTVQFLTAYPGWYHGRTIHIHCRILVDGKELLVSQVYFEDNLSDIIFGQHPDYKTRPARDTRNDGDNIFPVQDAGNIVFDFEKLAAGVLSASITIGVEV